jgi:hypothetical protein
MLFDLRGRGRRRTIQGIYLFLAVLMGGGLIFFGIGGGSGSGGLLNAVGGSSGSANGLTIYTNNVKSAQRQVAAKPTDPAGWASLAHSQYILAQVADYNQSTNKFTSKGRNELLAAEQAWSRYLALKPKQPDGALASEMVQALTATSQLTNAVTAQEIVVGQNLSSAAQFARLAELAYFAGQTTKGDLSSAKAVSLAPKAQQVLLKQQLASIKSAAKSASSQQAAQQQLGAGSASLPGG